MFKIPQKIDDFFGNLAKLLVIIIAIAVACALFGKDLLDYQQWKMDFFIQKLK